MKQTLARIAGACLLAGASVTAASTQTTDRFSQSYSLSPNGSLSVSNISGDIKIIAWDQDNIQVDAVKSAYRSDDLDRVKIEVDATSDRLEVRTRYPRHCDDCDISVDFEIKVPRNGSAYSYRISSVSGDVEITGLNGRFKANSVSGRVRVRQASGPVSASSVSGDIEVEIAQLNGTDDLDFSSVSGDVKVSVPAGLDADVRMNTFIGDVETDFPLTIQSQRRRGGEIDGQVGRGGRRISMKSVSGNVSLRQK